MIKGAKTGRLLDRSSLLAAQLIVRHSEAGDITDLSNEGHAGLPYPANCADADFGQEFPAFDSELSGALRHVLMKSHLDSLEERPQKEAGEGGTERKTYLIDGGLQGAEKSDCVPMTSDGAQSDLQRNIRSLMILEIVQRLARDEIEVPEYPPPSCARRIGKKASVPAP